MAHQVTKWEAADGSLHDTEAQAAGADLETALEAFCNLLGYPVEGPQRNALREALLAPEGVALVEAVIHCGAADDNGADDDCEGADEDDDDTVALEALRPGEIVRAALLDEYERRHGGDAVDAFMGEIGL